MPKNRDVSAQEAIVAHQQAQRTHLERDAKKARDLQHQNFETIMRWLRRKRKECQTLNQS